MKKGRKRRQVHVSRLGLALSAIYVVFASWVSSGAMQDGLGCPGGAIPFCSDELSFLVATLPISAIAGLIGIDPKYQRIENWIVYIGLSTLLYYFLGFAIEEVVRCLCGSGLPEALGLKGTEPRH